MSGWFFTTLPLASSAGASKIVLKPAFAVEGLLWHALQYVVSVTFAVWGAASQAEAGLFGVVMGLAGFVGVFVLVGVFAGVFVLGLVATWLPPPAAPDMLLGLGAAEPPFALQGCLLLPPASAGLALGFMSLVYGDAGPEPTNASQAAKQNEATSMGAIVCVVAWSLVLRSIIGSPPCVWRGAFTSFVRVVRMEER
jgi:hypothetical protein